MRNKIFGGIGIFWGGAIVVRSLFSHSTVEGSSAYQAGHSSSEVFGVLMLIAGLYYFFKSSSK